MIHGLNLDQGVDNVYIYIYIIMREKLLQLMTSYTYGSPATQREAETAFFSPVINDHHKILI